MAEPEPTLATQARWAEAFAERARQHWTPERTAQLLADKEPILRPAEAAVLLRALGLLRDDAAMPPAQVRKYFQINHMVALLGPGLRALRERHPTVRVLDAGCGRSYLTMLLAWCGAHVWGHRFEVVGLDRNPDVIAESRRRAELTGLGDVLRFEVSDVTPQAVRSLALEPIHAVVALHACDAATCAALALGVGVGAELLAVAPCCQAELARGWAALAEAGARGPFEAIWRAPHLRRETGADVTDAMRVALLEGAGYQVQAMEFVPAEHTRKNTLIRAVLGPGSARDPSGEARYQALKQATGGVGIALEGLLGPK